ncbi:DUF6471 domain-containing protein [Rheinheimera baltica]|jgi:hypothetical protein|uniref:DUF6471 domain-containing protein n=1 Tax=Rheinheimera baltica TaxID=67576 RepID=A0ABT9I3V6_9GAMM|nr:DUF6471 domain-containing protein [Rheinheimera baltica]MDP5138071.1 DUF6471 domain-containing protein [Rheinheimera baltica]MDP5144726.1 DUF6471 domain-containing protein [Rheinheimera baltica]MDP5151959.1 DUF6471 domain-containing protein [Rheinheimera baltica]MDP5191794.1 DUF6471 domain-containing protein [Rheinheimera baltica]
MSNKLPHWNCVASRLVKAELQKRGIKYAELSNLLANIGIEQTPANLRSKLSKGIFSASLLLQIFHVISADINPSELGVILCGCEKSN